MALTDGFTLTLTLGDTEADADVDGVVTAEGVVVGRGVSSVIGGRMTMGGHRSVGMTVTGVRAAGGDGGMVVAVCCGSGASGAVVVVGGGAAVVGVAAAVVRAALVGRLVGGAVQSGVVVSAGVGATDSYAPNTRSGCVTVRSGDDAAPLLMRAKPPMTRASVLSRTIRTGRLKR